MHRLIERLKAKKKILSNVVFRVGEILVAVSGQCGVGKYIYIITL